jgi:hypothetical protein|tara:strand:- start:224 stop:436 length:213 start_codon:yes stop_codon:yes gene_type:complete
MSEKIIGMSFMTLEINIFGQKGEHCPERACMNAITAEAVLDPTCVRVEMVTPVLTVGHQFADTKSLMVGL